MKGSWCWSLSRWSTVQWVCRACVACSLLRLSVLCLFVCCDSPRVPVCVCGHSLLMLCCLFGGLFFRATAVVCVDLWGWQGARCLSLNGSGEEQASQGTCSGIEYPSTELSHDACS